MTPAGATVRPWAAGDRAALLEGFLQLNRYEDAISGDRRADVEGAAESLDAALARVARTGGVALVAEREGRVVGHLFLSFETDAIYVRAELRPYAYVTELYVREQERRQGVGRALLAEAERRAVARGVPRLMIGVLAGNGAAEAMYRAVGFAPHVVEMVKRIGAAASPSDDAAH